MILKKPTKKDRKAGSIPNWERMLDRVVSEYVRRRDSNDKGICFCITCGHPYHWRQIDSGHYISRKEMSTRYDEKNINAQCFDCNRLEDGRPDEYARALDKKYGPGTAFSLLEKSKQKQPPLRRAKFEHLMGVFKAKVMDEKLKLGEGNLI